MLRLPEYLASVLAAAWLMLTEPAPLPVTVNCFGVFHPVADVSKVTDAGDTVAVAAALLVGVMVTSAVGWLVSATV